MADTRNIVIELKVRNDSPKAQKGTGAESKEMEKMDLEYLLHPVGKLKGIEGAKYALVLNAYNNAKSVIKNEAKYEIGKYFSLTENYAMQQDIDNALIAISKVAEFGSSILSGIVVGSAGGVGGALVGAIVGAVADIAQNSVQIYQRFDQQNRQLATANVQSQFQAVRMGLIDGGRESLN